jgi:hypothetical protein
LEALADEPGWRDVLGVEEVELGAEPSLLSGRSSGVPRSRDPSPHAASGAAAG